MFEYNAKALQLPLFFSLPLFSLISGRAGKRFLRDFQMLLPRTYVTSARLISLKSLENICVKNLHLI